MEAKNEELWRLCRTLPTDFEPFGGRPKDAEDDCTGCRWFQPLLRTRVPHWGVCDNQQSPRAGLLTFYQQGCDQFEQDHELTEPQPWVSRAEFSDRLETILTEAYGNFVECEICKHNVPSESDYVWLSEREGDIARAIGVLLWQTLKRRTSFNPHQAANETIDGIRVRSEAVWEIGRKTHVWLLAKTRKIDERAAERLVHLPNVQERDKEFRERVHSAIREALVQKDNHD